MLGAPYPGRSLFERLRSEGVHLFYAKTPAEFGVLGEANYV
jgi:hypothetical protein